MALFKIWGPVSALLLAALLAAGARADHVTTERCKPYHTANRVRQYPTDSNATQLWLTNCNYSNVIPNDLTGLTSVKEIYLMSNDIVSIHPAIFHSIPGLKDVWLSSNKLRELPEFNEDSCPNLNTLGLSANLITEIRDRIFSACVKLEWLFLDKNNIEYVPPKAFSSLKELKGLYLQGNKIRIISNQMFVNNHKLIALHLRENRISHLPLDFVSNFKRAGVSLQYFDFFSNTWHCACMLEALADVKRTGVRYFKKEHYDGTRAECVYTGAVPCRPTLLRPAPCPARSA